METVPLREWTELRVQHAEKTAEARAVANESAVEIAASQLTIRLDHANGLIAQMKDQAQEFARRAEVDLAEKDLRARVETLERARATSGGREALTHPIVMLLVGAAITYITTQLRSNP